MGDVSAPACKHLSPYVHLNVQREGGSLDSFVSPSLRAWLFSLVSGAGGPGLPRPTCALKACQEPSEKLSQPPRARQPPWAYALACPQLLTRPCSEQRRHDICATAEKPDALSALVRSFPLLIFRASFSTPSPAAPACLQGEGTSLQLLRAPAVKEHTSVAASNRAPSRHQEQLRGVCER